LDRMPKARGKDKKGMVRNHARENPAVGGAAEEALRGVSYVVLLKEGQARAKEEYQGKGGKKQCK